MSEQQPREYILVMRDNRFCLIGPFEGVAVESEWFKENWGTEDDLPTDPRWQTLELTAEQASQPTVVINPAERPDLAADVMNSEGGMLDVAGQ